MTENPRKVGLIGRFSAEQAEIESAVMTACNNVGFSIRHYSTPPLQEYLVQEIGGFEGQVMTRPYISVGALPPCLFDTFSDSAAVARKAMYDIGGTSKRLDKNEKRFVGKLVFEVLEHGHPAKRGDFILRHELFNPNMLQTDLTQYLQFMSKSIR